MAPHSSTLAWKIPWMEEPGGLQSWHSPTGIPGLWGYRAYHWLSSTLLRESGGLSSASEQPAWGHVSCGLLCDLVCVCV